jgi:hypothetical protein
MTENVERLLSLSREAREQDVQRIEEVERLLERHLAKLATNVNAPLAEAARTAQAAAEAATRVIRSAEVGLEAREKAELSQAARVREVLSGLTGSVAEIGARADRLLTAQADRLTEFEQRLEASRAASAERLGAQLVNHASAIGANLGATATLVEEGAGLLRAGGAEMSAVAEMFTTAVDRYRDASDRCVARLAELDEAVDRAGKKAAIELLTDYLDQTREVFEHSLEVQRELFAELRALRGRAAATTAEAPDVRA